MVQIQLINCVLDWERRLKLTEERRINHRSDPYVNYLAAPQSYRKERKPPQEGRAPADFVKALNPDL